MPDHPRWGGRHVLDGAGDRTSPVEPREIGHIEHLQESVIAPPGADHTEAARRRHVLESRRRKNLDVSPVSDLARPARAAADQLVKSSRLTLHAKPDFKSAPALPHPAHLPPH